MPHTRLAGMGCRSMEGDVEGLYSFLGMLSGFFGRNFFFCGLWWVVVGCGVVRKGV